jgi:hypothetical protein
VGSESGVSGTLAHKHNGLVHSSEWGDVNSLSSDGTSGSNSGRVLSGTSLSNSVEHDLEWVLSGKEMNDFKSLLENSNSLLFLTILSMETHHEHIGESFSDWASNLSESLLLISSSSVWDVHLGFNALHLKIRSEREFGALNSLVGPFSKKLWSNSKFNSIFNGNQFWF